MGLCLAVMDFCALQLAGVAFFLNLVREVMKTLSPLTLEEPISLGGMHGSIQVVGVNGSE